MNNIRRQELNKIIDALKSISESIDNVKADEEISFDSMPENLQSSERGEVAQEAIENMEEAVDNIENAIASLEEATI